MDLKPDDIFVDIDPAILLGYELDKLSLDNQLDVESLLSVEGSKINETTNTPKDSENQDLKTSVCDELISETEQDTKKDINGNEEPTSDGNLNESFQELDLSDSDNEQNDEEDVSKLRERGPEKRRTIRSRNQTNYLVRNERHDRSQFPPRRLGLLAGGSTVPSTDTVSATNQFTLQNYHTSILNISETVHLPSSKPVSSPYTIVYEDRRVNSVGSPESGYESSITGSPPRASLSASVSPSLDLISETDDDQHIIDFLDKTTAECALTGDNVPRCDKDDGDREGKINEIINFLKDIPIDENKSSKVVASCNSSVPSSSPRLRHVEIDYKLENRAKQVLRDFLSDEEFYAAKGRIYRQINEDISKNREVKVIRVEDDMEKTSENRTNLHHAVLKSNIEEIYCLVEIQKQYKKPLADLNIRDRYGKTALDYAVQNDMALVVDYLKENTACQSVNI